MRGCPTRVPLPAPHHTSCVTLSKPRSLSQPVCTERPEADTSSGPHPANPLLPLSPRAADKAGRRKLRVAEQDPACSGHVRSCCQFHWAALPHSGEQRALTMILKTREEPNSLLQAPLSQPFLHLSFVSVSSLSLIAPSFCHTDDGPKPTMTLVPSRHLSRGILSPAPRFPEPAHDRDRVSWTE